MIRLHPNHLQRQDLDNPLMGEPQILGPQRRMRPALKPNHLADSQGARAQYGPHLLLIEYFLLLRPLLDLLIERMIEVLIEQGYLIEGGAEGVL